MPATAVYIQTKIGATNQCAALDVSAACAGFLFGLNIADSFIKSGNAKTIGVIGSEVLTRVVDFQDRATCVLFGDGAGAVVVTGSQSEQGILTAHLNSNGKLADALHIPSGGSASPPSNDTVANKEHFIRMNGREIFKYAVRYLSDASLQALESTGLRAEDVDVVVPHQANLRILDAVAKRVGIPMDKFILNLERVGNTSSASIPIALDEAIRSNNIKENDVILMIALGGGLSWGSTLIKW
jgi:3-oxoacyl-[acyl-carrier-protein] synthase-3